MTADIKIPTMFVGKVEKRCDELFQHIFAARAGTEFTGGNHRIVAEYAIQLFPEIPYDAWFESTRAFIGQTFTRQQLRKFCWLLAANWDLLKEGKAVVSAEPPKPGSWLVLQVKRHDVSKNRKNIIGSTFTLSALTGPAATLNFTKFFSGPAARVVAQRIGFSAPWGKYPFRTSNELVGLRLAAQVDTDRSRANDISFSYYGASSSIIKWNRENVLDLRCRVNGEKCPKNYRHPCSKCAVGYTKCRAGTHALNFEVGTCSICMYPNAVFDPEHNNNSLCISCHTKMQLSNS